MAKHTRKMGKGKDMSCSSDMNDDEDDDGAKKYAKGGKVEMRGCKPSQTSGRKYSGVY